MNFGTLAQPTTVLFLGTDMVYSDPSRRHMDVESTQGNSDTIMLAFLNPDHNTVSVLNIPRDTEAFVGKSISKINSANAIGGPELARQTVSTLLDVPIDHYVEMNIQALVQLVNEVGGVTVQVPKRMQYMDWTGKLKIDLQPGSHTLTGNQAMGFVRFRHDALGDIGRIQRQQIFLQAAERKMLDPAAWMHVPNCMDIVQKNIKTDMQTMDMFQALNFIHSVPKENFNFVMLPGQFAGNGDWIATSDGKDLAHQLQYGSPSLPKSRRNITVCVVNASSNPKLGGLLSLALRKLGYVTCVGKDESEPASNKTRVIAQAGNVAEARMLQQDLGNTGEVVNASVGNLLTQITLVAHDDINLDNINLSSADAPYVAPSQATRPQPLVVRANTTPLNGQRIRQPASTVVPTDSEPVPSETVPDTSAGEQTPVTPVGEPADAATPVGEPATKPPAESSAGTPAEQQKEAAGSQSERSSEPQGNSEPRAIPRPSGATEAQNASRQSEPQSNNQSSGHETQSSDVFAGKHYENLPER
jgi:LCP family protein required for cell wall assembly